MLLKSHLIVYKVLVSLVVDSIYSIFPLVGQYALAAQLFTIAYFYSGTPRSVGVVEG